MPLVEPCPYPATFLIRTPIFEWYVVWSNSNNGYQNKQTNKQTNIYIN